MLRTGAQYERLQGFRLSGIKVSSKCPRGEMEKNWRYLLSNDARSFIGSFICSRNPLPPASRSKALWKRLNMFQRRPKQVDAEDDKRHKRPDKRDLLKSSTLSLRRLFGRLRFRISSRCPFRLTGRGRSQPAETADWLVIPNAARRWSPSTLRTAT